MPLEPDSQVLRPGPSRCELNSVLLSGEAVPSFQPSHSPNMPACVTLRSEFPWLLSASRVCLEVDPAERAPGLWGLGGDEAPGSGLDGMSPGPPGGEGAPRSFQGAQGPQGLVLTPGQWKRWPLPKLPCRPEPPEGAEVRTGRDPRGPRQPQLLSGWP